MSKISAASVLLLATGCGLVAALLVMQHVKQQQAQAQTVAGPALVPVVTAAAKLPVGTVIRNEHVQVVSFPEESVPEERYS